MREFSKIDPRIWHDVLFRNLETTEAKLILMYLYTSPHQNISGCFYLPIGYALEDLDLDEDRYKAAQDELCRKSAITYDHQTREVYIFGWFKMNPANGSKHKLGVLSQIRKIQSSQLSNHVRTEFEHSQGIKIFDHAGAKECNLEERTVENVSVANDRIHLTKTEFMQRGRTRQMTSNNIATGNDR